MGQQFGPLGALFFFEEGSADFSDGVADLVADVGFGLGFEHFEKGQFEVVFVIVAYFFPQVFVALFGKTG